MKKLTLALLCGSLIPLSTYANPITIGGDYRLRYEHIDQEDKDQDINRARIRLRIGINAEVTDNVDVGAVLATGSDDPVSTNQTLGAEFTSKGIQLDQAYATWTPLKGVKLSGGKIKNPWFDPAKFYKSELIWDDDLRPEGGAITYHNGPFFANTGFFFVQESGSDSNVTLYGAQGGIKKDLGFGKVVVGTGIHRYDTIKGKNITDFTFNKKKGKTFGNKVDADGNYVSGFVPWNVFAGLEVKAFNKPVKVYGEYVINTAADSLVVNGVETVGKEDTGWLVGVKLGKTKEPLSWDVGINWRELERDAVFATFTNSDFNGGGTGGKGLQFGAGLQLTKGWKANLTYFHSSDNYGDERSYNRVQADLKYKF